MQHSQIIKLLNTTTTYFLTYSDNTKNVSQIHRVYILQLK